MVVVLLLCNMRGFSSEVLGVVQHAILQFRTGNTELQEVKSENKPPDKL